MATTIVVSGAGGNIGSNMVVALRDDEGSPHLVGTESNRYHRLLSDTDETYPIPYATEDEDTYLKALRDVLETVDADVFLPSNIVETNAVVGADLPAATALPSAETVNLFANKWASYVRWQGCEVPVPETYLLKRPTDIDAAFDALPTNQVWIRGAAREGLMAVAGRTFTDPEIVRCWVDYHDGWGEFAASLYLPGDDCTWLGVYEDGELLCSQGRERLDYAESESWGAGAPSVSRTVHRDDVNRMGRRAIEAVIDDPHGVFFTDMRADASGSLRVTEVNPGRLGTTSSGFYPRAGFNVAELLVDIALGRNIDYYPTYDVIDAGTYYIQKLASEPILATQEHIDALD